MPKAPISRASDYRLISVVTCLGVKPSLNARLRVRSQTQALPGWVGQNHKTPVTSICSPYHSHCAGSYPGGLWCLVGRWDAADCRRATRETTQ